MAPWEQALDTFVRARGPALIRYAQDGGIDVESPRYVAQVKNYQGTVAVTEIRELVGVAAVDQRMPLFFTSGTYAAEAQRFAIKAGLPLFTYSAESGKLAGNTPSAEAILRGGL